MLDLADILVHCEDDRHPANEKDQDSQEDQAIDWDNIVVQEGGPWADGTEPHKDGQIQKHINGWLQ